MKRYAAVIAIVAVILTLLIANTDIRSAKEYYSENPAAVSEDSDFVTLTVECKDILDNYDKLDDDLKSDEYVPKDGIILPETEYVLLDGDTVFDLLKRALTYEKIPLDFQGSDKNALNTVYVKGINNIYEFSCGPSSGWQYSVNGETPQYGCGNYCPESGDKIVFYYVCDYSEYGGEKQ